jgi:hypothetical protein
MRTLIVLKPSGDERSAICQPIPRSSTKRAASRESRFIPSAQKERRTRGEVWDNCAN